MSQVKDIDFVLTANNSNQNLKMAITSKNETYWFTLWGRYEDNEKFQVDFDNLNRDQLEDLHAAIGIILEK
jgi:hypothetical protein